MLATAAPAVKLQDLRTPEQAVGSMASDQALSTFWNLVERLRVAAADQRPIHHVEEVIFRQLLVIGRDLLRAFLDWAGDGDVGPTLTIAGETPAEPPQVLPRLETPRCRPYLSIFGEVTIERVLRSRPPRRRPAGWPAASAPAAILLPAPAVVGRLRHR
ncbi:MAG: hypothetical protein JO355_02070 [Planctomycetaceae bacterium]|nr:hypothetical protein [Planctomycetaceae bacterium]